jgi:Ca-activated chloride channel family protein
MFGRTWLALTGGLLLITPAHPPRSARVTSTIEGTVREVNGPPLAGAQVMVESSGALATTGGDGRYRLTGLAAGPTALVVRLVGYQPGRLLVEVREGQAVRADFALRAVARVDSMVMRELHDVRARDYAAPSSKVAGLVSGVRRQPAAPPFNTEDYKHIAENGWRSPRQHPLSTFSIDVDAGSYSNVRRFISQGQLPPRTPCGSRS